MNDQSFELGRGDQADAYFLADRLYEHNVAPTFYQRHGYGLPWELADFPPTHQLRFLSKRLSSNQADETARPA